MPSVLSHEEFEKRKEDAEAARKSALPPTEEELQRRRVSHSPDLYCAHGSHADATSSKSMSMPKQ